MGVVGQLCPMLVVPLWTGLPRGETVMHCGKFRLTRVAHLWRRIEYVSPSSDSSLEESQWLIQIENVQFGAEIVHFFHLKYLTSFIKIISSV